MYVLRERGLWVRHRRSTLRPCPDTAAYPAQGYSGDVQNVATRFYADFFYRQPATAPQEV
ncbi:hypothetical protein GCM10027298_06310 [Epidermidibacterium keratini]